MKVYVVTDDLSGVPMEVFTDKQEADKFAKEKYCYLEKFKEPCVPMVYTRTLIVSTKP